MRKRDTCNIDVQMLSPPDKIAQEDSRSVSYCLQRRDDNLSNPIRSFVGWGGGGLSDPPTPLWRHTSVPY